MLRICYSENESVQRWLVSGQLAGPWVQEMRSCWEQASQRANCGRVVDLTDVTFVDQSGETLLADMRNAGVEFIVAGVETRYLIDNLKAQAETVAAGLEQTSSAARCGAPRVTKDRGENYRENHQANTKANGKPGRHK